MQSLTIKTLEGVEIPTIINNSIFDLKINTFHKVNKYDGVIDNESETFCLTTNNRVLVKTGLIINVPDNTVLYIITRVPGALKDGLTVLNSPLIITSEYTKEIEIILYNSSEDVLLLKKGYRIAQAILMEYHNINFIQNG